MSVRSVSQASQASIAPVADAAIVKCQEKMEAAAPVLKKAGELVLNNLPVIRSVEICLTSTALQVLGVATLKNLFYVTAAKELQINDTAHALTSRANYLEAAAVGIAVFVTNVAMALFFTIAAGLAYIVTLGKGNAHLNHAFHKHWTHASFGAAAIGIGALGTVAPTLGAAATGSLMAVVGANLVAKVTRDLSAIDNKLMAQVKDLFKQHRDEIVKTIKEIAKDSNVTQEEANEIITSLDVQLEKSTSIKNFFEKDRGLLAKLQEVTKAVAERKKAIEDEKNKAAAEKNPEKADGKSSLSTRFEENKKMMDAQKKAEAEKIAEKADRKTSV